jgi:hypothetical protein
MGLENKISHELITIYRGGKIRILFNHKGRNGQIRPVDLTATVTDFHEFPPYDEDGFPADVGIGIRPDGNSPIGGVKVSQLRDIMIVPSGSNTLNNSINMNTNGGAKKRRPRATKKKTAATKKKTAATKKKTATTKKKTAKRSTKK